MPGPTSPSLPAPTNTHPPTHPLPPPTTPNRLRTHASTRARPRAFKAARALRGRRPCGRPAASLVSRIKDGGIDQNGDVLSFAHCSYYRAFPSIYHSSFSQTGEGGGRFRRFHQWRSRARVSGSIGSAYRIGPYVCQWRLCAGLIRNERRGRCFRFECVRVIAGSNRNDCRGKGPRGLRVRARDGRAPDCASPRHCKRRRIRRGGAAAAPGRAPRAMRCLPRLPPMRCATESFRA